MHVFIELWNPKSSWLKLSAAQRGEVINTLGQTTGPVIEEGKIEVLGWGFADKSIDHASAHAYFAVWRAESAAALSRLREVIVAGGWYEHFDQVNVGGELTTPDVVLGHHIGL